MYVIFIVMCSTRSNIMIPYGKRTFSIVIIFMQIKQYDGSNDIQIMVIRASLPKRDILTTREHIPFQVSRTWMDRHMYDWIHVL